MQDALCVSWNKFRTKFGFILFLSIIIFDTAKGQINIHGSVSDSLRQPISFVSIALKSSNGDLIKSYLSDSDGVYNIALQKAGYYQIQFSGINYYTKEIHANFIHDTTMNIQLKGNPHFLQAVEITSRKPIVERKIDRVIYNIQNIASITGGDALDALKNYPVSESEMVQYL